MKPDFTDDISAETAEYFTKLLAMCKLHNSAFVTITIRRSDGVTMRFKFEPIKDLSE